MIWIILILSQGIPLILISPVHLEWKWSSSKVKVHIFWEGQKSLRNLHLTFVLCSARWRFRKILWPSQKIWTSRNLCFLHYILTLESLYPKLILVSIVADTLFSTNVIVLWNAKSSDCLLFNWVFKKQNKMWLSSSGISICVPLNR